MNILLIVQKLGIVIGKSYIKPTELHFDELNMATIKYKNHTSIKANKNIIVDLNNPTFSFDFICHEKILKEIDMSYNKKPCQNTDTLVKIIKENQSLISHFLYRCFNNSLSCSAFPTAM